MTLPELLRSLAAGGFTCCLVGCESIEIIGPTARLTPEVREAMRWHKPSLLALLQPGVDSYAFEERWCIQHEADFPPEAVDWPEAFTWQALREAAATGKTPIGWQFTDAPPEPKPWKHRSLCSLGNDTYNKQDASGLTPRDASDR